MSNPVILNDSFVGSEMFQQSEIKLKDVKPVDTGSGIGESKLDSLNFHSDVLNSVFSNDDASNLNDTPMFDELDFVLNGTSKEDWVSLFDADNEIDSNQVVTDGDLLLDIEESLGEDFSAPVDDDLISDCTSTTTATPNFNSKKRSFNQLLTPASTSTLSTPKLDDGKVDHLGVIKYNKKQRSMPLEPVKVGSNDPVLMKRAKNTEAARRSRARKMERMSQLEDKVDDLIKINESLNHDVNRFKHLLELNGIEY